MVPATPCAESLRVRFERRLHYGLQIVAHSVARVALRPWMRDACRLEGPDCARDFFARGYRHHVRGADTPPCCRRHLHSVLGDVARALDAAAVTWFACWGTFLGAVRHRDLIPWDRDADVVVLAPERERALAALQALGRPLRHGFGGSPDVLRVQASPTNRVGVDVEFWRPTAAGLVHADAQGVTVLPGDAVFPLVRRPFGALSLPTPCHSGLLERLYGPGCLTRGRRHEQRFGRTWVDLSRGELVG